MNPPVVPSPCTGGGGTTRMYASPIALNRAFSVCAIAPAGQALRPALVEIRQRKKHDRGVVEIDQAVDGQAGKSDRVLDAAGLQRDLGHPPHDRFGAVERRGIRELHDADQILLVLSWDESAGHDPKQEPRTPAGAPQKRARMTLRCRAADSTLRPYLCESHANAHD